MDAVRVEAELRRGGGYLSHLCHEGTNALRSEETRRAVPCSLRW